MADDDIPAIAMVIGGTAVLIMGVISININVGGAVIALLIGGGTLATGLIKLLT